MSPTAKAITAATDHIIQYSIQYSSIALVWYDFVLTFGMETQYIWRPKSFSWMTIPYTFLRYPLVANVLYLLAISDKLSSNCNIWYKFIGALSVIGRASVITIFTMRTVGVYNKNKIVTAWLVFLGLTCVVLDITHVPGLKCTGSVSIPIVPTLLSILVCAFELSSAGLIAARAIRVYRLPGSIQEGGILSYLLRQGLVYFCGVFAFQLTAVVLNFVTTNTVFQKLINALTLPMSCILAARFTLELRELDARVAPANSWIGTMSSLHAVVPNALQESSMEDLGDESMLAGGSRSANSQFLSNSESEVDEQRGLKGDSTGKPICDA